MNDHRVVCCVLCVLFLVGQCFEKSLGRCPFGLFSADSAVSVRAIGYWPFQGYLLFDLFELVCGE